MKGDTYLWYVSPFFSLMGWVTDKNAGLRASYIRDRNRLC
jgi:hypothetical protein